MRARKGSLAAAALAAIACVLADVAGASAATPTPRQIARAVARAEASPDLWATVNICSSTNRGVVVGVRGEIPTLGFRSTLAMTLRLDTWSARDQRFIAIASPRATVFIPLGAFTTGLQQDGSEFPFPAGSTGLWRATVTFSWSRDGRQLGRTVRTTTGGHPSADFSQPPHYSAATCRIG